MRYARTAPIRHFRRLSAAGDDSLNAPAGRPEEASVSACRGTSDRAVRVDPRKELSGSVLRRRAGSGVAGACVLGAAVLLSGCSLLGVGGEDREDEIPPLPTLEPLAAVETSWTADAGAGIGDHWLVLTPTVEGGRLYVADARGRVFAFEAGTGRTAWRTDTRAEITGGVDSGSGLVVAGTAEGEVLALSAGSGEVAWKSTVSSEVLSRPRVAGDRVVVRTLDGKLFGLDAGTGEPQWSYDGGVPSLSVRGTGPPAIVSDVAFAGFDNGRLAAVRHTNGEVLWEAIVSSARGQSELDRLADIDTEPVVVQGTVHAASYERGVAALDGETGRVLWLRDIETRTGLAADSDLLYAASTDGTVQALDRISGATVWTEDSLTGRGPAWPTVHGAFVAVVDSEGYVHWLRREDGRPAARTPTGGGQLAGPPIVEAGRLVVYWGRGRLAAYELR